MAALVFLLARIILGLLAALLLAVLLLTVLLLAVLLLAVLLGIALLVGILILLLLLIAPGLIGFALLILLLLVSIFEHLLDGVGFLRFGIELLGLIAGLTGTRLTTLLILGRIGGGFLLAGTAAAIRLAPIFVAIGLRILRLIIVFSSILRLLTGTVIAIFRSVRLAR